MKPSSNTVRGLLAVVVVSACGSSVDANPPSPQVDAGIDAAAPPAPQALTCTGVPPESCVIGDCTLLLPAGALPAGTVATLAQHDVPAELATDARGPHLCEVQLPDAVTQQVTLSIAGAYAAGPEDALFRYSESGRAFLVTASTTSGGAARALIRQSGRYGVTRRPTVPTIETVLGADVQTSADASSLLRNVASRGMFASFFDGTRLYVANGNRVLIYTGIPTSPVQKPAVVLGEPDLDTPTPGISSASFGAAARAIWSDGTKLVVGTGSRVLVWNTIPTTSFAPADIVLGQADFSGQTPNAGGVSGASLWTARAIDSDGARLFVADMPNNRVLGWSPFPRSNGEPASIVIGQPTLFGNVANAGAVRLYQGHGFALDPGGAFVTSSLSGPGVVHIRELAGSNPTADFALGLEFRPAFQANTLAGPTSVFRVPGGALGVIDASWRIAMFRAVPTSSVGAMDFVLGYPDATRDYDEPVSGASFKTALAGSATSASSSDSIFTLANGYRVLVWDTPPTYSFEPASRVIGQPGFSTNQADLDYRRISSSTLAGPADVAIAGQHVAVADRDNNRVLLFEASALGGPSASASVVLGQPDETSYIPNLDQRTPNAARLSAPVAVTFAGQRLVVADSENHRVLIWNSIPTTSGTPADVVLGQADFIGRRPNRGRGDTSPKDGFSDAGADGLFYPSGVASDGTRLFVSDRLNNRVLVWSTIPTTNGRPADGVIGQPDMTSLLPNRGIGRYRAAPDGLNLPSRLLADGTSLWIADTENNRVVRIDNAATAPNASAFVGQPDGSSITNLPVFGDNAPYNKGFPNGGAPTSSGSVLRPVGVALAGSRLYVSELASNRIHAFDATSLVSLDVIGQSELTSSGVNAGGLSAASLSGPLGIATDGTRLLVADSNNHRVVGRSLVVPPGRGSSATLLLGQSGFVSNGFNRSIPASAGGSSRPRGMVHDGEELYVAESDHNRIVVTNGLPSSVAPIVRVLGQPDENQRLPNSGGAPSASTLRGPRDVALDASRVAVADTGNNRVLLYPRASTGKDAAIVLGQSAFDRVALDAGGVLSGAGLNAPQGVAIDGERLIVADTANNRVLVWSSLPLTSGVPADLVLGQADLTAHLANRGQANPSAATMSLPTGVKVVRGTLYVADSGNNRILGFDMGALASGVQASVVLGQPSATTRMTVSDALDTSHLAGPTALTSDGVRLFVADRDLSRIVVFTLVGRTEPPAVYAVLGASTGFAFNGVSGVAAERTPFFTTRLYASDTNANRTLTVGSLSRLEVE